VSDRANRGGHRANEPSTAPSPFTALARRDHGHRQIAHCAPVGLKASFASVDECSYTAMRPNESPNTRSSDGACSPEHLHVCFHCAGELAYPLDWMEEGPRHWRIVLRCPDCESRREGVFEQGAVERLDDELDRAASLLLGDLKRMTHANMSEEVEFFIRALDADLIVPSDF